MEWRGFTLVWALLLATSAAADPVKPELSAPTLDGGAFDLAQQRGHPVLVNFWASWCVPCRAEMPVLSTFYRQHRAEGLVMIGISVDARRDLDKVRRMAHSLSYPVALAIEAGRNDFPAVNALPVTYLIDPGGMLRGRLTADAEGLSEAKLAALLGPLLPAAAPR